MKFQAGISGNPAGRPKGALGKATAIRTALEKHGQAVAAKVVEAALAGDLTAAKLVLERVCAPLRTADCPIAPIADEGATLAGLAKSIVGEAVNGRITTTQARELVSALAATARTRQVDELEARLTALEKRHEIETQKTGAGNVHWRR